MQIDTQTGFMKTSTARVHITGNLNVSVTGMNMEIPLIIDSKSEIKAIQ